MLTTRGDQAFFPDRAPAVYSSQGCAIDGEFLVCISSFDKMFDFVNKKNCLRQDALYCGKAGAASFRSFWCVHCCFFQQLIIFLCQVSFFLGDRVVDD
jgi:hypothetical protein